MVELSKRSSGVLMHISSLPSEGGIGTLGKSAFDFVDRLAGAGQTFWQILPICPTGFGDSPYQSFSTFAGNPYFIDLELLCGEGYLKKSDIEQTDWGSDSTRVDYALVYKGRRGLFGKLFDAFVKNPPQDYESFCESESGWLDDYALFMAVKDSFGGAPFSGWDAEFRFRDEKTLSDFSKNNAQGIEYYKMLQYFFFSQWKRLKRYANDKGIYIIGDLPIYVAPDSADVWLNGDIFALDENLNPSLVAGCPPDAFSEDGQLWGNPVYDWSALKKSGYKWWIDRLRSAFLIYDAVRIDHFRGFESFYCIKPDEKTARFGVWRKGPGMDFWKSVERQLGRLPVIAEDLGFLTDEVRALLAESGFPGMNVLQFAFDSREESNYLPHNYIKNSVVYTGTHDNDTLLGWTQTAKREDVRFAREYLRAGKIKNIARNMMLAALSSVSNTCILTMQDLIGLGSQARMNTPSTVGGNWQWRATKEQLYSNEPFEFLAKYTRLYGRKS